MDINNNWLIEPTGDPFADVGGLVIKKFQEKFPNKNIKELIEEVTKIYIYSWGGKLHSFYHGSKITNPSIKGNQNKYDYSIQLFDNLLNEKLDYRFGYCRISGRQTKLFRAGTDNFILSGNGGFVNFHHFFDEGLFVSKEILIRLYFVPFGVEYLGDKIALLHSNSSVVNEYFVSKKLSGIDGHFSFLGQNNKETGVLKSQYYNPVNALFEFADKCISDIKIATFNEEIEKSNIKGIILNLYHFTNFITSQDVKLYSFPSTLFAFYSIVIKNFKSDWKAFIYQNYINSKFKNAEFIENELVWVSGKKQATEAEFKIWRNNVYEKLLNNKSILSDILRWSKKRKFNFRIVEYYQIYVRNMEKQTIEKIKELADFIVNQKESDAVKKSISRLNGCKNSHDVRLFLLKLIDKNYQVNNEKPLITLDEYVNYLFPDGINWREIRDLLLIAIYQLLHEKNLELEIEELDNELNEDQQ